MQIELEPAEVRLVLKLVEANDTQSRKHGGVRTRASLAVKMYEAVDWLKEQGQADDTLDEPASVAD